MHDLASNAARAPRAQARCCTTRARCSTARTRARTRCCAASRALPEAVRTCLAAAGAELAPARQAALLKARRFSTAPRTPAALQPVP